MRTTLGHPVVTLNEVECHALYTVYCTHEEKFRKTFKNLDDPELPKRLGEELKYAREFSFPATITWKKLYLKLAAMGLMGFCYFKNRAALPCGHAVEIHEQALRSVKAKVVYYSPN